MEKEVNNKKERKGSVLTVVIHTLVTHVNQTWNTLWPNLQKMDRQLKALGLGDDLPK